MKLIESKTLGTAAASIEFTSIPQDGTDLVVLLSGRGTVNIASAGHYYTLSLNGSTSGFTRRFLQGDGSAASSGSNTNSIVGYVVPNEWTANTFCSNSMYFPNYTGSSNKSFSHESVTENNATFSQQIIEAFLWSNTAAITSITLTIGGGNFAVGTIASLYKVTKGSDGIVTTSP